MSIYCRILLLFCVSENFPNTMLKEQTEKGKTLQQDTQIRQTLESSFKKGFNNHSRLRSVCVSLQCKLGSQQTNEFSL